MIVDAALVGLLIYRPSIGLAAWIAGMIVVRHTPALALELATLLSLDQYEGWTAHLVVFLLPSLRSFMSNEDEDEEETRGGAVVAPVPGTTGSSAVAPQDRDITQDDWIVAMAEARDAKGAYVFSANQIDKAIGGRRAVVLARVKEIRSGVPPAQFRQDDGGIAPAQYPVSRGVK